MIATKDDKGKLNGDLVREHEAAIVAEIVQRLIGKLPNLGQAAPRPCGSAAPAISPSSPPPAPVSGATKRALEYRHVPVASQAGKGLFSAVRKSRI